MKREYKNSFLSYAVAAANERPSPNVLCCFRSRGWRWRRKCARASKRSPTPDDARGPPSQPAPRRQTARTMLNMKLKERLALALSAFLILFTLLLVVDLQMDYGISGHRVPLHGRVKIGDTEDKGISAYMEFRKRFLQKRLVLWCYIFCEWSDIFSTDLLEGK